MFKKKTSINIELLGDNANISYNLNDSTDIDKFTTLLYSTFSGKLTDRFIEALQVYGKINNKSDMTEKIIVGLVNLGKTETPEIIPFIRKPVVPPHVVIPRLLQQIKEG